MNLRTNLILVAAFALASCSSAPEQAPVTKADKPFAAAGSIEMQLDGGGYIVRAGPDERIRVSFAGNTGNAAADLGIRGTQANLAVRNTPHNNFRAIVEVPATATSPSVSVAAISMSPPSRGTRISTARPGTS